jgi:hypothetical protein
MITSRRMSWMGYVALMGVMRSALKILVPLVRPRRKWEYIVSQK